MKRADAGPRDTSSPGTIPEAAVQLLIGAVPDAMVLVDREHRIAAANGHAERLFGYAPGEIAGQPLDMLVPESLRAAHAGHTKEYFQHPRSRPLGN